MSKSATQHLPLNKLVADDRLKVRMKIDQDVVDHYVEILRRDKQERRQWSFPEISVHEVDGANLIVDGLHRIRAAKKIRLKTVPCKVTDSDLETATIAAASANAAHGQPLTQAEKRRAIQMVLSVAANFSDRRIAKTVGVSPTTVAAVRGELCEEGHIEEGTERIGRNGRKVASPRKNAKVGTKRTKRTAKQIDDVHDKVDPSPFPEPEDDEFANQVSKLDTDGDPVDVEEFVEIFRRASNRNELLAAIVESLSDDERGKLIDWLKNVDEVHPAL